MATPRAVRSAVRLGMLRLAGSVRRPPALPTDPRSILLIRPDHLGDLILAAPAVALLRHAFPASRITAWVGPWGEPVWRGSPHLDAIETCSFPGFTRLTKPNPAAPYFLALRAASTLRGRFDLAIDLRFDFWWGAMACALAGIPAAGYDVPECRPFLAFAVTHRPGLHETDQSLRLVGAVAERFGAPLAAMPGEQLTAALFPEVRPPESIPQGAIAIHAGAGAEVKLWHDERWARVADALAAHGPIVLTAGSPSEVRQAQRIVGLMRSPAGIVSGLSLAELAATYRHCRLALGPDNGPLHVARAAGTPTVTLFGPTNPAQFGPHPQLPGRNEVVRLPWRCIPCGRLDYNPAEFTYHLCVKLIEPEQVIAAARRVLMAHPSRSLPAVSSSSLEE